MADSNRRQGKSHVSENQELSLLNFNLVPRVLSRKREDPGNEVALIKDVRAKIFYSIDFFKLLLRTDIYVIYRLGGPYREKL